MLRPLFASVFLPVVVTETGNGAVAPVVALTALADGGGPAVAALMVAMLGIGRIVGDIPASILAVRLGDRRSMILSAMVSGVGYGACFLSGSLIAFGAALAVVGAASSTFYVARQSYVIDTVPVDRRARALSTVGGSHRIGLFIGPLIGAVVIAQTETRGAYLVAVGANVATLAILLLLSREDPAADGTRPARADAGSLAVLRSHRRLFATLGTAIVAVGAVRAARQTVVPVWAVHLGLDAAQTSVIFAVASFVDMALFYPAGKVMDEYGRLAVAIPSMLILGGTMAVLPLTGSRLTLTLVAIVMSFGNGIGAGVMMTLGADTAPVTGRIRFLGIWRLLSDSGNAAGPVVVSAVATGWDLAAGIVAVGSIGIVAAASLFVWVPRYSRFAFNRRRVAARYAAGSRSPTQSCRQNASE